MERNVVIEICKNLKWYEKIVVVIFNKIFVKVCHRQRIKHVNWLLH